MPKPTTICIAQEKTAFSKEIAQYFTNAGAIDNITIAKDGEELLKQAPNTDVIITSLLLSKLDGFSVLEKLQDMDANKKPKILVLTELFLDPMVAHAVSLGADYYMAKPFDMNNLYKRTLELANIKVPEHSTAVNGSFSLEDNASIDERISNIFLAIGVPAHIKGYKYLRSAIKMAMQDSSIVNQITKELYPGIAKEYDTSPSKVERAIRHAIEVVWTRGKIEAINEVFGYNIYNSNYKPTNGELIALLADKLSLEYSA